MRTHTRIWMRWHDELRDRLSEKYIVFHAKLGSNRTLIAINQAGISNRFLGHDVKITYVQKDFC